MKKFTIVGTNTDCGKTSVACALLEYYKQKNFRTIGFKPVASGGYWDGNHWVNTDTLSLQAASSIQCTPQEITPFVYKDPLSPHLAATIQGLPQASWPTISHGLKKLEYKKPDLIIVETSGGLLSPLSDELTCLDLCKHIEYPVILIIEIMLGCLSLAQLTHRCLKSSGIPYAGWIANLKHPSLAARYAIIQDLIKRLQMQPLGYYNSNSQLILHRDISRLYQDF